MFKDDFKKANDSIHADDELIAKVMEMKPLMKRRNPYRYISAAAAAVAVLSVTAAVMPKMMNRDKSGVISENTVIEDSRYPLESSEEKRPVREKADSPVSVPPETSPASTEKRTDSTAVPKETLNPTAAPKKNAEVKATPEAAVQKEAVKTPAPPDDTAAEKKTPVTDEVINIGEPSLPEYYITAETEAPKAPEELGAAKREVVLSVNYTVHEPENTAMYDVDFAEYSLDTEYITEEWDNSRYFEYLGFNLTDKLALPADFAYIGNERVTVKTDKEGTPSFDNRIFPFEGDGNRYVTVITSKNTLTAGNYLADEYYKLSRIYDVPAVVIGTERGYRCYMLYDGISFAVTADGVNEEELKGILASLVD